VKRAAIVVLVCLLLAVLFIAGPTVTADPDPSATALAFSP
jgi:hypothetical protein